MDSKVQFLLLRIEFPEGTTDRQAQKMADQLVEVGGGYGSVYIADEGVMDATDADDQS